MTVIFSKKCEYGMQAILYLAAQEKNTLVSAEEISRVLKIPREFISKILQSLRDSGLISSTKGKSGGFSLAKPASRIKLIDVVAAIDGLEMFDTCVLGFADCSPTHPCPVHHIWGPLRNQTYDMLTSETIDKLGEKTLNKIKSL
ncbi:MAG: Rrf2 family transcriptional regulator [Ignavibacteriota bacterium]|jgi:Rrf2 family protein|nr:MAG: Rrf2 family transcriptional regulator [Chlorobiota bacterium]MBE7476883.1 Rrf2 family transcriptional regulator [Ignavibacteriales bacterium]MBL1121866.1 Rrf2 family transcriptional regulator [Ignavibacteriota bacterium]MBV6421448.1 putative HTH-type transcriptional regulator [Ignavibacteriaceae bacterium]MCE7857228.1 Rrf2 family transcriptional regulator [Ignavibacteria bacterium CHB3]MEB2296438.1 Rrf2 family transcriptional regulator [Ignavibacteria bacterium]